MKVLIILNWRCQVSDKCLWKIIWILLILTGDMNTVNHHLVQVNYKSISYRFVWKESLETSSCTRYQNWRLDNYTHLKFLLVIIWIFEDNYKILCNHTFLQWSFLLIRVYNIFVQNTNPWIAFFISKDHRYGNGVARYLYYSFSNVSA